MTEPLWRPLAERSGRVAAAYEPSRPRAVLAAGRFPVPEGFGFVHADGGRGPRLSPGSRSTAGVASRPAFVGGPALPEPRA